LHTLCPAVTSTFDLFSLYLELLQHFDCHMRLNSTQNVSEIE